MELTNLPIQIFNFLILINFAGQLKTSVPIGKYITEPCKKRKPIEKNESKFIDDMTIAASINLADKLLINTNQNKIGPVEYHRRTNHFLPNEDNPFQTDLNKI